MLIPEILRGDVHLPLTESMLAREAIAIANGFYGTDLREDEFHESQAFRSTTGVLTLELIGQDSGEVEVTFTNKAVQPIETVSLFNPVANVNQYHAWMAPPVTLLDAEEMSFLDDLGSGNTDPQPPDNRFAWNLAQLLNEYNVLGRWVSGTMGHLAAGGFELVYKGYSIDAPDGFLMDYSPMLAIIRIQQGEQQGYLCLRS